MTTILIGLLFGFLVGAGCRWIDVPVPSPPSVPGALLVLAMTLGFLGTDLALAKRKPAPAPAPTPTAAAASAPARP